MPIGNALAVIRSTDDRYIPYKVTTFTGSLTYVGYMDGVNSYYFSPPTLTGGKRLSIDNNSNIITTTNFRTVLIDIREKNKHISDIYGKMYQTIAYHTDGKSIRCISNMISLYGTVDNFLTDLGGSASGDVDGGAATRFDSGAKFNNINGGIFDSDGNAYVCDTGNSKIKKINFSTLKSSTFVSTGFTSPVGITRDNLGNFYVVDKARHVIKKITSGGTVSLFAGVENTSGYLDGSGSTAKFSNPWNITCDNNNNLYVIEEINKCIRKITPDGTVSTLVGISSSTTNRDGVGSYALFKELKGIVFRPFSNKLYVTGSNTLREVSLDGTVKTVAGTETRTTDIVDRDIVAEFSSLKGMCFDSNGIIHIIDTNCIKKITGVTKVFSGLTNTFVGLNPKAGGANGNGLFAEFNSPEFLAFDSDDNLYVSDTKNHAIRKVTPSGDVSTFAGLVGSSGYADGNGINARFNEPLGIACDSYNNVYVSDSKNHCIRKITPAGDVTAFAGTNVSGFVDGINTTARFNTPKGLACDNNNMLYVADSENSAIRSIETNGTVSTIEQDKINKSNKKPIDIKFNSKNLKLYITYDGLASVISDKPYQTIGTGDGSTDGTDTTAKFKTPYSLAIDKAGSVYVTDPANNNIRKITPA
jgi:sugar lactone lactonase YvrE